MGNIKGWGGPMTLNFLYNDLLLNKQVYDSHVFLRCLDC